MEFNYKVRVILVSIGESEVQRVLLRNPSVILCFLNLDLVDDFSKKNVLSIIKQRVAETKCDILITYRCPFVLDADTYTSVPLGAYNIHPSMLPKYKGLNPWEQIFRNKEKNSGVTLHRICDDVDGGDIILQKPFIIYNDDDVTAVRNRSDKIAAHIVHSFFKLKLYNFK